MSDNTMGGMNSKQSFALGLVGGVLVLCTIGFFVMLGMMMKGDNSSRVAKTDEDMYPKKFSACLDDGETVSLIEQDTQLAASLGVNGTPATFFNGYLVSGALPYSAVEDVVNDLLRGEEPMIDDFELYGMESGELAHVDMPDLPNVVWEGNKKADVSVVEFADFECPYCARFAPTIEQLLTDHSDEIRYTYRHFPLSFHPNAQKSAEAYECAKAQGKGFEMYEKLYDLSNGGTLSVTNYKKAAGELGLK